MSRIAGSFEELTEKITDAARKVFPKRKENGRDECAPWVYVDATFPDHVIVSKEPDGGGRMEQYRIDYTVTADGEVTLGKPDRVQLRLTVVDDDGDEDEPGPDDEAIATRFLPAIQRIAVATRLVSAAPEVKALESLDGLQTAAMELMDSLSVKGLDMRETLGLGPADPDVDPDSDDLSSELDPDDESYDPLGADDDYEGKGGLPGADETMFDTDTDDDEKNAGYEVKNDGRVVMDADAVAAEMAELGL